MATVLISFIGTGTTKASENSRSQYETVTYNFSEFGEATHQTSIFSVALLKFLKPNEPVDKWLIFGSSYSIWCDLLDMFDNSVELYEDSSTEIYEGITVQKFFDYLDNEAKKDKTDAPSLQQTSEDESDLTLEKWQDFLNSEISKTESLNGTQILCRLVGYAADSDSHNKIFKEIYDVVQDGNKIVFDVTHGLRNQPIITSFVIMYLRYLRKDIKADNIEFYYGAKDLDGKVFRLDFCNELLKATEAVAIFEQTGNYQRIGKNLKLSDSFNNNLEKLTFLDEVNRTNTQIPNELNEEISKADFSPLQESLAKRFRKPLHWASKSTLSKQLSQKALFAFERKQYYKAVLILLEAIIVAYGESCGDAEISNNLDLHFYRDRAEKQMLGQENGKPTGLNAEEIQTLKTLKKLRNAIAHGTDANGIEPEAIIAREAIDDEKILKQVFNNGNSLFAKIKKGEIGQ